MFKIIVNNFIVLVLLQISLNAREINLNKFINNLKKDNKHLLIWMHKTDCGYCEGMKEFTLQNDTVKSIIDKRFIFVHININEDDNVYYKSFEGAGRDFAMYMGYNLYPTTFFFDENLELVYTEMGYYDNDEIANEERFYNILNYVSSKSYTEVAFDEYKFILEDEL